MAGCGSKKMSKGGSVRKYANGGMVAPPPPPRPGGPPTSPMTPPPVVSRPEQMPSRGGSPMPSRGGAPMPSRGGAPMPPPPMPAPTRGVAGALGYKEGGLVKKSAKGKTVKMAKGGMMCSPRKKMAMGMKKSGK